MYGFLFCNKTVRDILIEILEFYGGGVDGSITAVSIKSVTPTRFDAPRAWPSTAGLCILAPILEGKLEARSKYSATIFQTIIINRPYYPIPAGLNTKKCKSLQFNPPN